MRNQRELAALVHEILVDDYLVLAVRSYSLQEDLSDGAGDHPARIQCRLSAADETVVATVTGAGVGMVDALFRGLKAALSVEYPSLSSIHFADFQVVGDFGDAGSAANDDAKSDAPSRITVGVESSAGRRFDFETTSRSLSAGTVAVVVQAVEHFVNSERAVLRVFDWVDDAKKRGRADLADKYVQTLAELVSNTSYSATIEKRQAGLAEQR